MKGALHQVKISGEGVTAHVFVDGEEIHRLSGYTIERNAGEIPMLELRMLCFEENIMEQQTEIVISNAETMARIFNREQFDEFCRLWEEYHERSEGQTRDNRQN